MKKSVVIALIDKMVRDLYKNNEIACQSVKDHNNGGIHYLRELKFKIEKLDTTLENSVLEELSR